jgi:hypothetical protein
MGELLTDGRQPGAIVRAGDDSVATELAAKDFDLGLHEAEGGLARVGK